MGAEVQAAVSLFPWSTSSRFQPRDRGGVRMHGRDARNPPWQMHICVSVLSVYVRVVSVGGECMCKCMWVCQVRV